jgi:hypothetical protein
MIHIKKFEEYSGMSNVISSQPSETPGISGTDGSGDIPFYLTDKKKRKKGNISEVSDLRDLEPEKNITKIKESLDDYIDEVKDRLKSYNIRPIVLTDIINQYHDKIEEYYDDGKYSKIFVDEIIKDMELDSGGYMKVNYNINTSNSNKYL